MSESYHFIFILKDIYSTGKIIYDKIFGDKPKCDVDLYKYVPGKHKLSLKYTIECTDKDIMIKNVVIRTSTIEWIDNDKGENVAYNIWGE